MIKPLKHSEMSQQAGDQNGLQESQVIDKRRGLLALLALLVTTGCSSSGGSSSSVRDTNPGYYGHTHFHRSPYRRSPRRY